MSIEHDVEGVVKWYNLNKNNSLTANQYHDVINILSRSDIKHKSLFNDVIEQSNKSLSVKNENYYILAINGFYNYKDNSKTLEWFYKLKATGFKPKLRLFNKVLNILSQNISFDSFGVFKTEFLEMKRNYKVLTKEEYKLTLEFIIRLYKTIKVQDMTKIDELNDFFSYLVIILGNDETFVDEEVKNLLLEWFSLQKRKYKVEQNIMIRQNGRCKCGVKLHQKRISKEERKAILKKINNFLKQDDNINWISFKQWLESKDKVDIVIDGANVAHFWKSSFKFDTLLFVLEELEKLKFSYLIVLRRITVENFNGCQKKIVKKWEEDNKVYIANYNEHEDYYWIHYALEKNAMFLTNDKMTDHSPILLQNSFVKWKKTEQIHFDGNKNLFTGDLDQIEFLFPEKYSKSVQIKFVGSKNEVTNKSQNYSIDYIEGGYSEQNNPEISCIHIPTLVGSIQKWICVTRI